MLAEHDMRAALMALGCLALAACSDSQLAYIPPSLPTVEAITKGVKQAADEAKFKPPL
jgi:hypothetical protein